MPKSKQREKKRPGRNKRIEKKIEAVNRLNSFVGSHIKKLEIENERMKTDPDGVIGQIIPQLRQALTQNKKLSVLAAALISAQGGSIKVSKEDLEQFETKVLSIKWELPEGVEKPDDASEFVFTYEALTQEEAAARAAQVTITPPSEEQPTKVEIVAAPAEFEAVGENEQGEPINDLGLTQAGQADFDAIAEAHDSQIEEDESVVKEPESSDAEEDEEFEQDSEVAETTGFPEA